MSTNGHYDVIIIGTCAGGGTLAYKLAGTGKKILLVERGDHLPRERENWISREVVNSGRYNIASSGEMAEASRFTRIRTITSAATPCFTAPRSFVSARRTSAGSVTTAESRRRG